MDSRFSSSENELKSCAKTPASQFLLLPLFSPPFNFIQSTPFLSLNPNLPSLNETSIVVREVQKSIVSNIDKCFKLVVNFRSRNAVFDKIMSFSSYLQNCCQIPHRHCRSMPLLLNSNFAAILPGDSVAGIVVTSGISNFLNIYNTLLIVRLVLTWFPNAPPAIVSPLSTLCDPYLNIFRGIIPPLGGLDLSPILAFFVLNVFSSAAAALPAELPSTETSKDGKSLSTSSHLTASQKKWMRRLSGNESKHSNGEV